ncbi:MAG: AAA family ATPase [Muribaculaceae bacterium]|nr:AAA family ATPase [Muribaculaceae bacterium]
MGYPIAGMVFSTKGEAVEGLWTGADTEPIRNYTPAAARERLQSIFHPQAPATMPERGIDDLIGLKSVKTRLKAYTDLVRFNRMRGEHGLPQMPLSLHAMFLGSPGTGKTTVAKIIGRTLRDIGVLSSGHVVVRERATLLGKYYNSEAENVRKALDEASGGILFIDEAYQLHQPDDPKDPGKFVIETLLTALADDSDRDWMLILAGYSEPMKRMFDMNPGLRSRIPPGNIYHFDDFNPDELMQIALAHLARYRFTLTREAGMALKKRLDADYAARRADFGNARHVVSMIENEILPSMARRLCNTNAPDAISLSRIVAADIPAAQPLIAPAVRRLGFAV